MPKFMMQGKDLYETLHKKYGKHPMQDASEVRIGKA